MTCSETIPLLNDAIKIDIWKVCAHGPFYLRTAPTLKYSISYFGLVSLDFYEVPIIRSKSYLTWAATKYAIRLRAKPHQAVPKT